MPAEKPLPVVGARAVVNYQNQLVVGTVTYAGTSKFASGQWVGIVLDTPDGKNNGSVKGQQYFTCKPNHGLFVRPDNVQSCMIQFMLSSVTPPRVWLMRSFNEWHQLASFGVKRSKVVLQLTQALELDDLDLLREILPQAEWMGVDQSDVERAKERLECLELRSAISCKRESNGYSSNASDPFTKLLEMQEKILDGIRRASRSTTMVARIPQALCSDGFKSCLQNNCPDSCDPVDASPCTQRLVLPSTSRETGALPTPFHPEDGPCGTMHADASPKHRLSLAELSLLRNALTVMRCASLCSLQEDSVATQESTGEECLRDELVMDYVTSTSAMSAWARTPNQWRASVGGLVGLNPFDKRTDMLPDEVIEIGRDGLLQVWKDRVRAKREARTSTEDSFKKTMNRGMTRYLKIKGSVWEQETKERASEQFSEWVDAQLTADAEIDVLGDENWTPACLGDGGGVFFGNGPKASTTGERPVFLGPLPRVRKVTLEAAFPIRPESRLPLPRRSYCNSVLFSICPQWERVPAPPRRPWVEVDPLVLPEASLSSYVARSTIMLHVGGAGCGIGSAVWDRLEAEHHVDVDGTLGPESCGSVSTHFYETSRGYFVPRAVLLDARPDGLSASRFSFGNVVRGSSGFDGNWADAYYSGGESLVEGASESLRRQLEIADSVNGIMLTFAGYGGAGGGLTSKLLRELNVVQAKLPKWSFCLVPPVKTEAVEEPEYKGSIGTYNTVFTLKAMLDYSAQVVTLADNDAIRGALRNEDGFGLPLANPTIQDCNELLGRSVASVTSPLRIGFGIAASEGTHLAFQRKIETNLIPYPRIMFTLPRFARLPHAESDPTRNASSDPCSLVLTCLDRPPLLSVDTQQGRLISTALFLRDVPHFTALTQLQERTATAQCVDWCPSYKLVSSHRDPTVPTAEVVSIMNHTCLGEHFCRPLTDRFEKAFSQRENVANYICAGMEEDEFIQAQEEVKSLAMDYQECARSSE
eukprot:TRINITY_DN20675_c0_g1_i1.p1 TRINITY_DN20675_c0_g1~~TRINITY_DN20675_c0_g1_i1.p1  ORF type:complete len:986 (-),score=96.52 TRINITY_DN20675_c0_g1_i1:156-3113(-)